jgi:hypothetical protein
MRHAVYGVGFRDQKLFDWKASWDYIWTSIRRTNTSLFIPRDKIPASWWSEIPEQWHYWPTEDLETLREYVVDMSSEEHLNADVEKNINSTLRSTGSMRATKPIEIVPTPLESYTEAAYRPTVVENLKGLRHCWSTANYKRGFGSQDHRQLVPTTYELWAAEALIEVCRKR